MISKGMIDFNSAKMSSKPPTSEAEKIDKLIDSQLPIYRVQSFFPFDLFPDEIIVNQTEVSVILKHFFGSDRRYALNLKSISDVMVDSTPFFSTIKIVNKDYIENTVEVKFLKKDEALKMRKIIQGLIIANTRDIDLTKLTKEQIIEKTEKLGEISD